MWKKTWITLMLVAATASAGAHASLLIEPYGGYSVGSIATKISDTYSVPALQGTTDSGSANGFAYGGRVGFMLHHFVILAAEYQGISASKKLNSSTTSENMTQKTLFATLGFQAPGGLRLMGSYGWDAQADDATTPTATHLKGTAYKLALGWHLPMPVALNLEYTIYKFTDYTQGATSGKLTDVYSKLDYSTVMATISFPLTLFHFGGGGGRGSR